MPTTIAYPLFAFDYHVYYLMLANPYQWGLPNQRDKDVHFIFHT